MSAPADQITGLTADTAHTVAVTAIDTGTGSDVPVARSTGHGTTRASVGGTSGPSATPSESGDTGQQQPDPIPAVTFVIYCDPVGSADAVERYRQATALLAAARISYSEVTGGVRGDVDRLAAVSNSVMPPVLPERPHRRQLVAPAQGEQRRPALAQGEGRRPG